MPKRAGLFGIVFALCILIVPGQIHVRSGNLWSIYLEKNVESLLVLFRDGECVVLTDYLEHAVSVPYEFIFKDHEPSEAIVVIHNHLGLGRWSEADKAVYHRLKEAGFKGFFLCRLGSGAVIHMED